MESVCSQCKKTKILNIMQALSCSHIICEHCYWRILIDNHFAPLKKINFELKEPVLSFNCKCQNGEGSISLQDYMFAIQKCIEGKMKFKCKDHPSLMAEIYCNHCHIWFCSACFRDSFCREHIEPNPITSKCLAHNYNDIDIYCNDCKFSICKVCKELYHTQHRVTLYDSYKRSKTINQFQYKKYEDLNSQLNQLHKKAIDSYMNVLNNKLKRFDDLIKKIEDLKHELKMKMENKAHQISTLIQLLKMTYQNMYLDTEVDLNQIVSMKKNLNCFLYNISITPEKDDCLLQIENKLKSYSALSTFNYDWIFKKSKLSCYNAFVFKNEKITAMASIGTNNIAIAFGNSLFFYNLSKNILLENHYEHEGDINSVIVLSENIIATGSSDKSIRLWDIHSNIEIYRFLGHLGEVTSLCLIKQGVFASAGNDSMIKIWNYATFKEELSLFDEDDQGIKSLINLSNSRLASAGVSEKICIWNYQYDEEKCILYGHVDTITKLLLLTDKRIASSSLDKTIKIWKNKVCQISLEGHDSGVLTIYQLNDNRLISGSMDQTCRLWDLYANKSEQVFKAHNDYISVIVELSYQEVYKEKENLVLTAGYDYSFKIWK